MVFPLRTFCTYATGLPQDMETCLSVNLLRMKQSQLVIAGTTGCVQVYKVSKNPSAQDMVLNHETNAPIIGIGVGIFSSAHNSLDESEKLELAVIHPNYVEILVPKKSETGAVELEQVCEHEVARIVSFALVHKADVGCDANGNKRQYIESYICVKTLDSQLIVMQRRITAKAKLGFRYAMPGPINYSPLADLLIIGTFEYSIVAIRFSDLLDQQNNVIQDKEAETNLKVVFEFVLNDRIQQILCGRFFRSESIKTGEICVVLTRELVFIDSTGKLIREIRFDSEIINCTSIYSTQNKYTEVLSLLALEKHRVSLVCSGVVRFRNQFEEYSPQIPSQADETSDALSSVSAERQKSEFDDQEEDFIVKKAPQKVPLVPRASAQQQPLKGLKTAKLNVLSYPVNIISTQTVAQEFNASNHAIAELCPEEAGLFGLCYADGTVALSYFGTSNENYQQFKPVQLPTSEASKLLKEQLSEQLKDKKLRNKAECEQKLECSIKSIDVQQSGIQLDLQILFESASDLIDVTCYCTMLCACEVRFKGASAVESVLYMDELDGMRQQNFGCTVLLKAGCFTAPQNIHIAVSSVFCDSEFERLRVSVEIPLPLFGHNIIGVLPPQKLKYAILVQFETPFGTLVEFLRKRESNAQIAGELGENALAIKNLDGSVCLLCAESNSAISVQSDKLEQLYAGVDFLMSYNLSCAFKYDRAALQLGLEECIAGNAHNKQLQIEDKLAESLSIFQNANQQVQAQLHAALPGPFKIEGINGRNAAHSMEILADYIDGLCQMISRQDDVKGQHVERIRGIACLLVALRHKEPEEVSKERSLICAFNSVVGFKQLFGRPDKYLDE